MLVRFLTVVVFLVSVLLTAAGTTLFIRDRDAGDVKAPAPVVVQSSGLDKDEVKKIVSSYIEDNPTAIIDAFTKGRAKQAAEEAQRAEKNISARLDEIENDPNTPVVGNPNGDVTIVKFSDYNCGYCKRVVPDIIKLLDEDKNVKLVVKDFPILGARSVENAKTAIAAYKLDKSKYFDFHVLILKKSPRNDEQLLKLATEAGYDAVALKEEAKKPEYANQIQKNISLAQSIGINGTPAFIVDGELVRGAVGLDVFKQKISAARAKN